MSVIPKPKPKSVSDSAITYPHQRQPHMRIIPNQQRRKIL